MATTTSPTDDTPLAQRLALLSGELQYALSRADSGDVARWTMETGSDFVKVLGRRATNLTTLLAALGKRAYEECREAYFAYELRNLGGHLQARAELVGTKATELFDRAANDFSTLQDALKSRPGEVAPRLLSALATSLLVSGGPDGDGGAPDLDLVFGIGAHRSVLSHSILMGSALETAFLSLLRLVRLVHGKLPPEHDKGWDALAQQADAVLAGAIAGASIGMAYHLVIDGLVQPAAFHDLPFSAPMEVHEGIILVNAAGEAQDLAHKEGGRQRPDAPAASAGPAGPAGSIASDDEAKHKRYLRRPTEVGFMVAALLPADCLSVLQRQGAWMDALADGTLRPMTEAQVRFVRVARWEAEPVTLHEHSWYAYSLVRIALMQALRPSLLKSFQAWWR